MPPTAGERHDLTRGTLYSAALAVAVAQLALAIPAVLQGLFQKDLVPSSSQLTWISDAFLVPVTLLELTFGVLGDLFGRKRLMIIGAAMLAVGEGVAVLTPGTGSSTGTRIVVLWIGMIIAGAGAAAVMPTSLAMVAVGTHTPRSRARAVTIWAAALSADNMLSPVLGGWLAGFRWGSDPNASWRWAPVAIGILALVSVATSAIFARNSSSPEGRSLDWGGQVTVAVALFALMFAVIQGPTAGGASAEVIVGFIVAVIFLVLFIMAERCVAAPLLDQDLFKNRAFSVASIASVIGMFCFLGTAYSTSIRLTAILLFTPLHAAIAFVLFNGIALPMIPVTQRLLHNYNPRWTMGTGLALMAAGDLWTSGVPVTSQVGLSPVIAPYVLIGIGFALAVSALTAVLVDTVPNPSGGDGQRRGEHAARLRLHPRARSDRRDRAEQCCGGDSRQDGQQSLPGSRPGHLQRVGGSPPPALAPLVGAVNSGPLGANSVPDPPNPLKTVAFDALGHANAIGYVVCGIAGLVAALLVVLGISGGPHKAMITEESLEN
jgi:MFS family permease